MSSDRPPAPLDLDTTCAWLRTGAARISLEEWLLAAPVVRDLISEAAKRVQAEHVWLAAFAGQGQNEAAAVLAIADGGRQHRRMALRAAAAEAMADRPFAVPEAHSGRVVAAWGAP